MQKMHGPFLFRIINSSLNEEIKVERRIAMEFNDFMELITWREQYIMNNKKAPRISVKKIKGKVIVKQL